MNDTTNTTHMLALTLDRVRVKALAAKVANDLHDALLEASSDIVREALHQYGIDDTNELPGAMEDLIMNEWIPDAYQAILRAAILMAQENLA